MVEQKPTLVFKFELVGHEASVVNAKFTLDGEHCLSTSQDRSIGLWAPKKGKLIKLFKGNHNREVNDVAIFKDKTKFVSVGGDKLTNLWDVAESRVIRRIAAHTGSVNCCELDPENQILFTGSYDRLVHIWDLRSYSKLPVQIFREAKDSVTSVRLNKDLIFTGSVDGSIRTYDIRRGTLSTDSAFGPITDFALSSENDCIVVSSLDNKIRLMDVQTGDILGNYQGHKSSLYMTKLDLDESERFILSGSQDNNIYIWDIVTCANPQETSSNESNKNRKQEPSTIIKKAHNDIIFGVNICKNNVGPESCDILNKNVVSFSADRTLKIWELKISD